MVENRVDHMRWIFGALVLCFPGRLVSGQGVAVLGQGVAVLGQGVAINELMPAPAAAGYEFIELVFTIEGTIHPGDISLRDNSINWSPVRFERPLSALDTLVLVKSLADAKELIAAGIKVGTLLPWPTLNNGGDSLFVRLGSVIEDRMGYSSSTPNVSWERKAPYLPGLFQSSWALSTSASGASPGRTNTVYSKDLDPPRLVGAEINEHQTLVVWFSEAIPHQIPIQVEGGIGTQVIFSANGYAVNNRITFALNSLTIPEWIRVKSFSDYAGNTGVAASVAVARPPEAGDLVFSEIHFMEGGLSTSAEAPEFVELASLATHGITLAPTTILFRGLSYRIIPPDSMAILSPGATFILAARSWTDWETIRLLNQQWLETWGYDPFVAAGAPSAKPLVGLAPWISFKNEGEVLELRSEDALLDTVSFDPSCFDARFSDHKGRSLSRVLARKSDGFNDSSQDSMPVSSGSTSDLVNCPWASTLFESGISPGAIPRLVEKHRVPAYGDLVLTEVMFDPLSDPDDFLHDQVEFVELVNASSEPIALQDLWFAEMPDENGVFKQVRLASSPVSLLPYQVAVFFHFPTPNPDDPLREKSVLAKAWPRAAQLWNNNTLNAAPSAPITAPTHDFPFDQQAVVFIPTRKSLGLPNTEGRFRILNSLGQELAQMDYSAENHYQGLESTKGRSLYRPVLTNGSEVYAWQFGPWTSSTSEDGATPGVLPSLPSLSSENQAFQVSPRSFYPERDDLDHEVVIQMNPSQSGAVLQLDVFDSQGFLTTTLVQGQFLAEGWTTSWNGRNSEGRLCPTGVYIVVARIFDPKGREVGRHKQPISLLRR